MGFLKILRAAYLAFLLFEVQDPETRIVAYLRANVRVGQPVIVSDLYNRVFTSSDERAVLNRLYSVTFKLPRFLVEYQKRVGRLPSLAEISAQQGLPVAGEADVLLRILEVDPGVPRYLRRDPKTGEVLSVDADAITADPRFGKALEHALGGWEGKAAPPFAIRTWDGASLTTTSLAGKPYVLYFWFSNCEPCLDTGPLLVGLQKSHMGLEIIGMNADQVLELPYTDAMREAYARSVGFRFPLANLTPEMQEAYGTVSVFPTLLFVDRKGKVVKELVNLPTKAALDAAARLALAGG